MDVDRKILWRRWLSDHGAVFDGASPEPLEFGDAEAEYRALRDGAALIDRSGLETVRVRGEDATRFFHGLTTGDVASMPDGSTIYTLITDDRGRVLSDIRLLRRDARDFDLVCERGFGRRVVEWLEAHRVADRVTVEADGPGTIHFELAGSAWRERVSRAGSPATIGEGEAAPWSLAGREGLLLCDSAAALLRTPLADAGRIWGFLVDSGFRPAGERAAERTRIEKGRPRAGREFDSDLLPMEVGLEAAVSYTKGCYVGQEIIARATHRGHVHRTLVGLRILEGEAPVRKAPVKAGAEIVGWITSAVEWRGMGVLALACVRRENAVMGGVLRVAGHGGDRDGIVSPFTS